jgi:hypothetical protein
MKFSALMLDEQSRQKSKLQEHSHISTPPLLQELRLIGLSNHKVRAGDRTWALYFQKYRGSIWWKNMG